MISDGNIKGKKQKMMKNNKARNQLKLKQVASDPINTEKKVKNKVKKVQSTKQLKHTKDGSLSKSIKNKVKWKKLFKKKNKEQQQNDLKQQQINNQYLGVDIAEQWNSDSIQSSLNSDRATTSSSSSSGGEYSHSEDENGAIYQKLKTHKIKKRKRIRRKKENKKRSSVSMKRYNNSEVELINKSSMIINGNLGATDSDVTDNDFQSEINGNVLETFNSLKSMSSVSANYGNLRPFIPREQNKKIDVDAMNQNVMSTKTNHNGNKL